MIAFIVCLAYIASIFSLEAILVAYAFTITSLFKSKSKAWDYLLFGALVFHFICVGGVIIILGDLP